MRKFKKMLLGMALAMGGICRQRGFVLCGDKQYYSGCHPKSDCREI